MQRPLRAAPSRLTLLSAALLVACQAESVAGPFGLRVDERLELGSVAAAIRSEVRNHPVCPLVPSIAGTGWVARTLARPAGSVSLPPLLQAVSAPTGEASFFAPDMSAGVFVQEAPGLASLQPPEDSPLSHSAITTCQLRLDRVETLVYLISQSHPVRAGDSVHLAFVQVATPGDQAIRAGAFAITRELRDSLVGALLAFQPEFK